MFRLVSIYLSGFLVAGLITTPLLAELHDPTRPTGFMPDLNAGDSGMQASEGMQLQAIFYSPQTPGALINGRRYSVGDQVGDAKIEAIYSDRVVLISVDGERELNMKMPSVKSNPSDKQQVKPQPGEK